MIELIYIYGRVGFFLSVMSLVGGKGYKFLACLVGYGREYLKLDS